MTAPAPEASAAKNPLLLSLFLAAGLTTAYAFLSSPWELLRLQDSSTALGTWALAPFALAAAATLFGGIEPTTARKAPELPPLVKTLILLFVPLVVIALISSWHQPLRYPPHDWISRLFPTALSVGAGVALTSLFWQGVTQQHLPEKWNPALRILFPTALASLVFTPFWFHTASDPKSFFLWLSLSLLLLIPALLYELGLKIWQVSLLAFAAAAAAIYAHPAPFLL